MYSLQTWQDIKINSKKTILPTSSQLFPTFPEYHGISDGVSDGVSNGVSEKIVFDEVHFSDDAKVNM